MRLEIYEIGNEKKIKKKLYYSLFKHQNCSPAIILLSNATSYMLLPRPILETLLSIQLGCVKHVVNIHHKPISNFS